MDELLARHDTGTSKSLERKRTEEKKRSGLGPEHRHARKRPTAVHAKERKRRRDWRNLHTTRQTSPGARFTTNTLSRYSCDSRGSVAVVLVT